MVKVVLTFQEGILKLADFGNAVHFGTVATSSYQVSVTDTFIEGDKNTTSIL